MIQSLYRRSIAAIVATCTLTVGATASVVVAAGQPLPPGLDHDRTASAVPTDLTGRHMCQAP